MIKMVNLEEIFDLIIKHINKICIFKNLRVSLIS